ncbi:MAG TPA: hypothetical protein VJZ94_01305, partial [Candidatus Paceibacterota bacterium]|nr:hypothetical protein [Candidatus Paceibacterota bacterium]
MPTEPIRWQAFEHGHLERGGDWYIALGIAAISIALTSIILGNVLFGILIVVAAFVWGMMAQLPHHVVDFEISERGIRAGEHFYLYESVIAFWVEEHKTKSPLLLIDTTKFMTPNLAVPLENVDPKLVRAYLLEHVDEV